MGEMGKVGASSDAVGWVSASVSASIMDTGGERGHAWDFTRCRVSESFEKERVGVARHEN